jgi:hypothetical protein
MLASQQSIGKWTFEMVQMQYQVRQILKATYSRSQASRNGSVGEINFCNHIEWNITKYSIPTTRVFIGRIPVAQNIMFVNPIRLFYLQENFSFVRDGIALKEK